MKIVFLVAEQDKPHEGVARPFLNLASGMRETETVLVALFRCGPKIINHVNELDISSCVSNSRSELVKEIEDRHPDFVICDDTFLNWEILNSFKKKARANIVVYVQVLYGVHAISSCFDLSYLPIKEKTIFSLSRFIPFSLLIRKYNKVLDNCDIVIANSNATASILQTFYGVDVHGVVYPPIDTEVFKPIGRTRNPKDITFYLGSHAGDTQANLATDIVDELHEGNYTINLFGTEKLATILKKRHSKLIYHQNIEDKYLAELYSKSLLTICPQKWETFGYVQVESMSCGTPALSFDCMGPTETIMNLKTGWMAKSRQEFLMMLRSILENKESGFDQNSIRKYVEDNFSIKVSAKKLDETLRAIING
jgi:glycosyltransferase involved in cell wall biosynthesis